jgi:hypothetical protein
MVLVKHLGTDRVVNVSSIAAVFSRCHGNKLVFGAVTQLLYSYLVRDRCLAAGPHATIYFPPKSPSCKYDL